VLDRGGWSVGLAEVCGVWLTVDDGLRTRVSWEETPSSYTGGFEMSAWTSFFFFTIPTLDHSVVYLSPLEVSHVGQGMRLSIVLLISVLTTIPFFLHFLSLLSTRRSA
jgi:hypothetical protein